MVRIISFDADGTLFRVDILKRFWFQEVPRLYAEKHSIGLDLAVKEVKDSYREIGPSDVRWYLPKYWFDRFGLRKSPRDVIQDISHEVSLYGDARDALIGLSDDFYLIVVSNSPREILETQVGRIPNYFDSVYSSVSDFDRVKDDVETYRLVCQDLDVDPSEILHIGDNREHDFEVPRKIGINALHLDRYTENEKETRIDNLRDLTKPSYLKKFNVQGFSKKN